MEMWYSFRAVSNATDRPRWINMCIQRQKNAPLVSSRGNLVRFVSVRLSFELPMKTLHTNFCSISLEDLRGNAHLKGAIRKREPGIFRKADIECGFIADPNSTGFEAERAPKLESIEYSALVADHMLEKVVFALIGGRRISQEDAHQTFIHSLLLLAAGQMRLE